MAKHNIEAIARVCHEANRAYSAGLGEAPPAAWDDLDEGYRQGIRHGVLQAIHGDNSPEAMHESWRKERIAQGWKLGAALDREKKVHPNLVAYDELPEAQRRKDRLFAATVKALTVRMS